MDEKCLAKMKGQFSQVDVMLEHNRMLINEINRNHETQIPADLTRNVSLIDELDQNIKRVVERYVEISQSFVQFFPHVGNDEAVGDNAGEEEEFEQEGEEEDTAGGGSGVAASSSVPPAESGGSSDSLQTRQDPCCSTTVTG